MKETKHWLSTVYCVVYASCKEVVKQFWASYTSGHVISTREVERALHNGPAQRVIYVVKLAWCKTGPVPRPTPLLCTAGNTPVSGPVTEPISPQLTKNNILKPPFET